MMLSLMLVVCTTTPVLDPQEADALEVEAGQCRQRSACRRLK